MSSPIPHLNVTCYQPYYHEPCWFVLRSYPITVYSLCFRAPEKIDFSNRDIEYEASVFSSAVRISFVLFIFFRRVNVIYLAG